MSAIDACLADLDSLWMPTGLEPLVLRLIGSGALMIQHDYSRGTSDGDVLETDQLDGEPGRRLVDLAGRGTEFHRRHGLYLDLVPRALPFLPSSPVWHPIPGLDARLTNFRIEGLDVVDVVVSNLKRFHASDRSDIAAMVDRGLVPHDELVDRFRRAMDRFLMDARATEIPDYLANLNRVERDHLGVRESRFELPDWL